jgi:cell fate (sporulation/competence/biofilm development) regulator YmcA (YheA/YmcA/DUF963 family)
LQGDACYACPTNKERNAIQAAIFQKHIQATHPNVTCDEMPPEHTLIIEGNITSSISHTTRQRIDRHLRHRIITSCGDANVMMGSKHIDPALCIYIGAYLICIDNKHLTAKVPRGNGTLCRVLGVKLKDNAQSYKWKNYYGKKVWTVNAADVEWVECEHVNKSNVMTQLESQIKELKNELDLPPKNHKSDSKAIKSKIDELNKKLAKEINGRIFKLEPEQFTPEVTVKHYHASSKKIVFRCKMMQIPANSNDATTGHKLQGMSKDAIIVSSWPTGSLAAMFKNWEYVVLSRVRTLSGLYLVKPIDMDKSFQPSPQLASYMDKIRKFEKDMLEKRQQAISRTFSN